MINNNEVEYCSMVYIILRPNTNSRKNPVFTVGRRGGGGVGVQSQNTTHRYLMHCSIFDPN